MTLFVDRSNNTAGPFLPDIKHTKIMMMSYHGYWVLLTSAIFLATGEYAYVNLEKVVAKSFE